MICKNSWNNVKPFPSFGRECVSLNSRLLHHERHLENFRPAKMEKFSSIFHIVPNFYIWHQLVRGEKLQHFLRKCFPPRASWLLLLLSGGEKKKSLDPGSRDRAFKLWFIRSACAFSALVRDRLRFLADPSADKFPLMFANLPHSSLDCCSSAWL